MVTETKSRFELQALSVGSSRRIFTLFSLDCPLLIGCRRFHTAETEMVGAGVDFAFAARADDVTLRIF